MSKTTRTLVYLSLLVQLPVLVACGGGSGGDLTATDPADGGAATPTPLYQPPAALDDGWLVGDALALGADKLALESFATALEQGAEWPDIDAVSIAWRGRLVYERTLRSVTDAFDEEVGNTDPAVHAQFSVSKSVASLLIGIAIGQGVFDGVEVSFLSLFDYPEIDNMDDRKAAMRLVDVLTMTAGFAWNEWQPPYHDPDNQLFSFQREHYDLQHGGFHFAGTGHRESRPAGTDRLRDRLPGGAASDRYRRSAAHAHGTT